MSNGTYTFGYRSPRFRTDFHLFLQTQDRQTSLLDGRCTDISEDGLGAEFRASLEVGTAVALIFTLPGNTTSVRVSARVTNRKGGFHGFVFLFSSQKERDYVYNYLDCLRANVAFRPTPSK